MPINTGALNQRVDIQVDRPEKASNGQDLHNWSTSYTRWASVNATTGRKQRQEYDQVASDYTHRVVMRADSLTRNITTNNQLLWKGKILHIASATEMDPGTDEARVEIQCNYRQEGA